MAKGLLASAMLSGLGQGVANAAGTGMQVYSSMLLQQQREQMEERKVKLMEQYATAREQRGYDFQRGLQQERIGSDMVNRSLDRQSADAREERGHDFQRGMQQERIGADTLNRSLDRGHADALEGRREEFITGRDQTALGGDILRDTLRYRHDQDRRDEDRLEHSQEFRDKLKEERRQHDDRMGIEREKLKSDRKLSKEDELFVHILGEELKDLRKEMTEPTTSAERVSAARQEYNQARATLMQVLGHQETPTSPNIAIRDRFGNSALNGKSTPKPPPSAAPRGERVLPPQSTPTPAPTLQNGPTDALDYGANRAIEGVKNTLGSIKDSLFPQGAQPYAPIVREPKEQAISTIRGDTNTALKDTDQEQSGDKAPRLKGEMERSVDDIFAAARGTADELNKQYGNGPTTNPLAFFNSPEFDSLSPRKQQDLRTVYHQFTQGNISRDVVLSSVHAVLDDSWGTIKAEQIGKLLNGMRNEKSGEHQRVSRGFLENTMALT